jgi:hypothetical protein
MSQRQRVVDVYTYIEEGSIERLRDTCNYILDAVAKGEWTDVYINYEFDDLNEDDRLAIVGSRWETDGEMKKRLKREKEEEKKLEQKIRLKREKEEEKKLEQKIKVDKEANERKMYEKLKKKFEGK